MSLQGLLGSASAIKLDSANKIGRIISFAAYHRSEEGQILVRLIPCRLSRPDVEAKYCFPV